MSRESVRNWKRGVVLAFVLGMLGACSSSDSTQLFMDERTPIRVGLNELFLDLQVDRRGFVTVFSEESEDLVCRIIDDSGDLVAQDDDSGLDLNCAINTVLEAGTYRVGVSGYEASDRGGAFVTATMLPQRSIEVGDVARVEIDAQAGAVLTFAVSSSGGYLISTSGRLDTVCRLFNEAGAEIASNDDFGDDVNCGVNLRLEPGSYAAIVSSYEAESGSSSFMVSESEIKSYTLMLGAPRQGRLDNPSDRIEFEFTIEDASRYILRTSGATDTVCELRGSDGELMDENDDGDDQNCRINHALAAGDYRFSVSGYAGETGSFSAHLDQR